MFLFIGVFVDFGCFSISLNSCGLYKQLQSQLDGFDRIQLIIEEYRGHYGKCVGQKSELKDNRGLKLAEEEPRGLNTVS